MPNSIDGDNICIIATRDFSRAIMALSSLCTSQDHAWAAAGAAPDPSAGHTHTQAVSLLLAPDTPAPVRIRAALLPMPYCTLAPFRSPVACLDASDTLVPVRMPAASRPALSGTPAPYYMPAPFLDCTTLADAAAVAVANAGAAVANADRTWKRSDPIETDYPGIAGDTIPGMLACLAGRVVDCPDYKQEEIDYLFGYPGSTTSLGFHV
jgi:hypothetical protein